MAQTTPVKRQVEYFGSLACPAQVGRRYIVCHNQEGEDDDADRASILAALERHLEKGPYLKTINEHHLAIDRTKVEED